MEQKVLKHINQFFYFRFNAKNEKHALYLDEEFLKYLEYLDNYFKEDSSMFDLICWLTWWLKTVWGDVIQCDTYYINDLIYKRQIVAYDEESGKYFCHLVGGF